MLAVTVVLSRPREVVAVAKYQNVNFPSDHGHLLHTKERCVIEHCSLVYILLIRLYVYNTTFEPSAWPICEPYRVEYKGYRTPMSYLSSP